jgi:hypothetical protein
VLGYQLFIRLLLRLSRPLEKNRHLRELMDHLMNVNPFQPGLKAEDMQIMICIQAQ